MSRHQHVHSRKTNLQASRNDNRQIEVVANGLPLWGGAQVAVDTTLVSPVRSDGAPRRRADVVPGIALVAARQDKERTYPELLAACRCRLTVLALEVGGRWSDEAVKFIRLLSKVRARSAPAVLCRATAHAFVMRWSGSSRCRCLDSAGSHSAGAGTAGPYVR